MNGFFGPNCEPCFCQNGACSDEITGTGLCRHARVVGMELIVIQHVRARAARVPTDSNWSRF